MSDTIKLAERQLLAPGGLERSDIGRVLGALMGPAVDSGDLYFQSLSHESWVLEDGLVRSGTHAAEQGVGIRAISGEKTGFAYADEIVLPSLLQASGAARAIAAAAPRSSFLIMGMSFSQGGMIRVIAERRITVDCIDGTRTGGVVFHQAIE